ncbi:MAG: hypothetical protein JWM10_5109 [Myxococcaceae bacterium]|nr:hypothetical protein [Myxococcaceae bacterium]
MRTTHLPPPPRRPASSLLLLWGALLAALVALCPREAAANPASRVYVGVYLRDVTRFDQRNGTFDVDMEAWVKWLGDFDPSILRIANESSLTRDDLGTENDAGWHVRRWRLRGTLRGEFPLQRFPFDDQALGVAFELPERDGTLMPDLTGSGMEGHFSITGWNYSPHFRPRTERLEYPSDLGSLSYEGRGTVVRRARFEVTLHRPVLTIALKLFLPLVLILLVAMLALFLPAELIDARSGIGVTALLACFAFQFSVASTIPDVAYLTVADALFLVAYAMTALALFGSVVVYWLHRGDRVMPARRIDLVSRVGLPLGGFLVTMIVLRPGHPPAAPRVPPLAASPRLASARPLLRVGVAELPSLMTGVVTFGTRRGLVYVSPDGERQAFLAERVPEVGNDALQVNPDGTFEVRWRLRPNLRWSDGHALTSDDVRFALEASPDPHVRAVRTPDARTVTIVYDGVLVRALDGVQPLPRHRLGDVLRRGGYDAVTEARRATVLPGTGPYRVVRFAAGREVVLEANPFSLGAPPSIARIQVRCIADHAALAAAFERHEVDMVAPSVLTLAEADALAARSPGAVLQRPSNQLYALQPDPSVALLQSAAVRTALLQAIDRDAFAQALFGVAGHAAVVPVTGDEPAGVQRSPFDLDAAREALVAEGVAGQTLRLTHGASAVERDAARLVAEAWTAAGVTVERQEVASVSALARSRTHGGVLLQTMTAERDTEPRRFWNLPRRDGRFVIGARTEAFDDAAATLTDREERALFPERQAQLQARLMLMFSQRLPLLPLAFGSDRYAVSPALKGWDRGPGVRFGEAVEQWRFVSAN